MSLIFKFFFIITIISPILKEFGLVFIPSFYDEFICYLLLFSYLTLFKKFPKKYLSLIISFFVINIISALNSSYSIEINRFALDTLLFLKPILFLIVMVKLSFFLKGSFNFYLIISRSVLLILVLLYPLNFVEGVFEKHYRFGLESYQAFFPNPGYYSNIVLALGLISSSGKNKKTNLFYLIATILLMLISLRFKSFVVVAFIVLIFFNSRIYNKVFSFMESRISARKLFSIKSILISLPILGLILIPGYTQFKFYFLSGEATPRLIFWNEGINFFLQNFPFGLGPGFFGSAAAKIFYSPVYLELGWDSLWGFSGDSNGTNFLNDNFWPMIIAQYGFLGLIIVLTIYKKLIYDFVVFKNRYEFRYSMIILFSLIMSTLGASVLIGNMGLFLIFGKFIIESRQ